MRSSELDGQGDIRFILAYIEKCDLRVSVAVRRAAVSAVIEQGADLPALTELGINEHVAYLLYHLESRYDWPRDALAGWIEEHL